MAFWTDATKHDPKRKFRFLVEITGLDNSSIWYAKSITKPQITVGTAEHLYLNHKFYYPGNIEWNEITLDLVDPVEPDAASQMAQLLVQSGYPSPATPEQPVTLSKRNATIGALKSVIISQIDADGGLLEVWTLKNAFITGVNYGDLAYGDEELTQISVAMRYDWAELKTITDGRQYWSASS
jgi:hypothetical protein